MMRLFTRSSLTIREPRERGLRRRAVADVPVEAGVPLGLVPDERRALGHGLPAADHSGKLVVVDLDQQRRGLGLVARLGHDDRDLVADVAHAIEREGRVSGSTIGDPSFSG
jgi:hypothetical protein